MPVEKSLALSILGITIHELMAESFLLAHESSVHVNLEKTSARHIAASVAQHGWSISILHAELCGNLCGYVKLVPTCHLRLWLYTLLQLMLSLLLQRNVLGRGHGER